MTETAGLIEIETYDDATVDVESACDDATLDDLFARLVGRPRLETMNVSSLDREPALVLSANLDALAEDLQAATREVLSEIFLSRGRR